MPLNVVSLAERCDLVGVKLKMFVNFRWLSLSHFICPKMAHYIIIEF